MRELWVFLPALGSPLLHAPVLKWDLFPRLNRPLDGGALFRGRRVFGDNKTWRGAFFMTSGTVIATALLSLWPAWWHRLPQDFRDAGPWLVGLLLGLAVVVGELPNSFLKRRLGIAPGKQRHGPAGVAISIYDQADWVPAAWLLLLPVHALSALDVAIAFAIVTAIHVPINVIGYAIGARTDPI